jgi:hypothetical protein
VKGSEVKGRKEVKEGTEVGEKGRKEAKKVK